MAIIGFYLGLEFDGGEDFVEFGLQGADVGEDFVRGFVADFLADGFAVGVETEVVVLFLYLGQRHKEGLLRAFAPGLGFEIVPPSNDVGDVVVGDLVAFVV